MSLRSVDEWLKQATDPALRRLEELCALLTCQIELDYGGNSETSGSRRNISSASSRGNRHIMVAGVSQIHTGSTDSTEQATLDNVATSDKSQLEEDVDEPYLTQILYTITHKPNNIESTAKNIFCSTHKFGPSKIKKYAAGNSNSSH